MHNLTSLQPLSDDELDRLGDFLDAAGEQAMNLEMLDGFFAALICGPDMVLPSEYLASIWGEDYSFDSDDQANDIVGLIFRHWNNVAAELRLCIDKAHIYLPVLFEREDGVAPGNDWAHGFMRGVAMRPASWGLLLDDEEHGGCMVPIMALHHEHDPDPEMRPAPFTPDKREELLHMMIAGVPRIYRYFEPYREARAGAPAYAPLRRNSPKIGRNDPCPCGSGRKYKQCCAANAPTLH